MSNQYTFTSDWFLHNQLSWDIHLEEFKNKPNLNFLEIGSYEGRSTIWLLENVLTDPSSKITCIDLFDGTLEENNMENDPNLNLDDLDIRIDFEKFLNLWGPDLAFMIC